MDFDGFSDIVKVMASNCPNYVTTLVGWPKDDAGVGDIKIFQFGLQGGEGLKEEALGDLRKIFQKEWKGKGADTNPSGIEEEEEAEFDYINDDDIAEIDVNVTAMEEITVETEMVQESMVTDQEIMEALNVLEMGETIASPKASKIPQQQPSVPPGEQATPKAKILQTPAFRSCARIITFVGSDDEGSGEDEGDSDEAEGAGATATLQAPNFNLRGNYDSDYDSDYESDDEGGLLTSAPVSFPLANLASGWSSTESIASQASHIAAVPAQPLASEQITHPGSVISSHIKSQSDSKSVSTPHSGLPDKSLPKIASASSKCSLCEMKFSSKDRKKAAELHFKRFHTQSIVVMDKESQRNLGDCRRDQPAGKLSCHMSDSSCTFQKKSWRSLENHIQKTHNGGKPLAYKFTYFPSAAGQETTAVGTGIEESDQDIPVHSRVAQHHVVATDTFSHDGQASVSSIPTCSVCKLVFRAKGREGKKALATHFQRFHGQSVAAMDKDSQRKLGDCKRDQPAGYLSCCFLDCIFKHKSWSSMVNHIQKIHNNGNPLAYQFTPFPPGTEMEQETTVIGTNESDKDIPAHSSRNQKPIAAPENLLVTTDTLSRYGLAFNLIYKLIICVSCGEGFSLKTLYSHLKSSGSSRTNWNPELECWQKALVVYENHPLGPQAIPYFKNFSQLIVDSLSSNGYISNGGEIRDGPGGNASLWRNLPLPEFNGEVRPQVLGLRVFSKARECKKCGYIAATTSTMKSHNRSQHGKASVSTDSRAVTAQTLSEVSGGWAVFFKVSSEPALGAPVDKEEHLQVDNLDSNNPNVAGALRLLHQKKAPIMNSLDVLPDLDIRTVLSIFVGTGIDSFLRPFNRKILHSTYQPNRDDEMYSVLRFVILKSFQDDIRRLVDFELDPSILRLITNCTPNTGKKSLRREFSPLTEKKSVAAYALLELKFVWALIRSYRLKPTNSNQAFLFNDAQQGALANLVTKLGSFLEDNGEDESDNTSENSEASVSVASDSESDKPEDSSDDSNESSEASQAAGVVQEEPEDAYKDPEAAVRAALYRLLNELYFPTGYRTKNSAFESPPIAFVALQCLTENGSYSGIHLIPPIIAKLQYSFRLRASHKLLSWKQECLNDETFYKKCQEFCETFLQDFNLAPFSKLQRLLHMTSVVSKSTARPNLIWWQEDTLTVGPVTCNIPEYKVFLLNKLRETEKFVEQNILLGVCTLQDIEMLFNISKLKEIPEEKDVLGNGILLGGGSGTLDNEESGLIFFKMLSQKKLGLKQDATGNVKFGRDQSTKWVVDIDMVMADIQSLCHTTEGPGVGRMTEDSLHSPINTLNGARNIVFEVPEGTGGFRTGYHKGSFTTGKNKEILRLLPYRIFRLLYVLIHIIRPIELAVLFDHFIKPENQQAAVNAYRERIWASFGRAWTPTRLSNNLQRFMKLGMGVKMGARLYRHFVIAIQRHYPATNYGRYDTGVDKTHALAADLMAGHTPAVAEMYYAHEAGVLDSASLRAAFIRVSKDWHRFLGLSTSISASDRD